MGLTLLGVSGPTRRTALLMWLAQRRPPVAGSPGSVAVQQLPRWFCRTLFALAAVVLSGGTVGLVLAFFGIYRGWLAIVLGLTAALALVYGARRLFSPLPNDREASRSDQLAAVALGLLVAISVAVNIHFESSHVQLNRDPGAYAVTGKWIATQGSLQVAGDPEWAQGGVDVDVASLGTFAHGATGIQFQFDHFVPVLLAEADAVGGDRAMFAIPAILGGLALAAIYALGCRLLRRPWLVFAAVAALAVSMPQLNVSRDTYSETATQLMLWVGLWLLSRWLDDRRPLTAVVSGLFIGSTVMTRIDAVVYLVALPLLLALAWIESIAGSDRRRQRRSIVYFAAALIPGLLLGTIDLLLRSYGYYLMLRSELLSLWVALAVMSMLAVGLALAGPRMIRRIGRRREVAATLRVMAPLAGVGAGLVLLALWRWRPLIQSTRQSSFNDVVAGLQKAENRPIDGYRLYAEDSVTWMSWYLGPITIGLACLGLAVLVHRALSGDRQLVMLLTALSCSTALYLWRPSIVPDQIWATRRFVPAIMPLLVLSAAAAVGWLATVALRATRSRVMLTAVLLAGAVVLVVAPARTSRPVAQFSTQSGYDAAIKRVCALLGPDAAVAFEPGGRLELNLLPTVRSWCDAPVAALHPGATVAQVQTLARTWKSSGRTLWILSGRLDAAQRLAPDSKELVRVQSPRELAQTLTRAPYTYSTEVLGVYGAPMPVPD